MNKSRSIQDWATTLLFSLLVAPWTILIGTKLAIFPAKLTEHEKGVILNIRSEIHEATLLSILADFVVIGLMSFVVPTWLAIYLWVALIMSYFFLFEVLMLTIEDNNDGEML